MIGNYIGSPIGGFVSQGGGTVTIPAAGAAAGAASATAVIKGIISAAGTAAGSSTATGVGASNATDGLAEGSSTVTGVLRATSSARGTAAGHATALAVSNIILVVPGTGIAQGSCSVQGRGLEAGARYYTTPRSAPKNITTAITPIVNVTTARSSNRQITA